MELHYIISPILSFLVVLIITQPLIKLAITIGLVDQPNHRKVHKQPIPLIGGLSIFIASSLALGLLLPFKPEIYSHMSIYISIVLLLIVGVIDDQFEIRAILKLAVQLALAHVVYSAGIRIESMYGIFGVHGLSEWMQYALTIFIITGVVNAFNLMDGIDGLAAGLALLGFSVFSILAYLTGQYDLLLVYLTIIGALASFLRFNLSKRNKAFMGDAGSLIIGFILVVSAIKLLQASQNTSTISTVAIGVIAVLIVPVFDALRVFRRRMKAGKSPFSSDKTHLHHLILFSGLNHKPATIGILLIVLALLSLGYLSYNIVGINLALISMLFVFAFITKFIKFFNQMKHWKHEIQDMEVGIRR